MKHWQLVSFLLFFWPLLDSPTAANVLQHVRNEFDRLWLRFKPFSICTDNCAVMKKAFVGLPELTDIEDANQEPEEDGFLTKCFQKLLTLLTLPKMRVATTLEKQA